MRAFPSPKSLSRRAWLKRAAQAAGALIFPWGGGVGKGSFITQPATHLATVVKAIWWNEPADGGINQILQNIRISPGVWSAAQLVYDPAIDPPTDPPFFDPNAGMMFQRGLSAGSITQALAGQDGIIATMPVQSVGPAYNAYALRNNVDPPSPLDHPRGAVNRAFYNLSQGAWWFNNAWWVIAATSRVFPLFLPPALHVYKSTDDRVTWVEQDAAHAPLLVDTPADATFTWAPFWDGASNLIRILISPNGDSNYSLQEFDMNTGLWGTQHDSMDLGNGTGATQLGPCFLRTPDGDSHIFYRAVASNECWYARFHLGVWTVVGLVVAAAVTETPRQICCATYDALVTPNRVHFTRFDLGLPDVIVYQQVVNGALGVSHTFAQEPFYDTVPVGHPIVSEGNELLIPYEHRVGQGNINPHTYRGFPLSDLGNPASWTDEVIDATLTNNATCTFLGFGQTLVAGGGCTNLGDTGGVCLGDSASRVLQRSQ